jgi:hypothetical protein
VELDDTFEVWEQVWQLTKNWLLQFILLYLLWVQTGRVFSRLHSQGLWTTSVGSNGYLPAALFAGCTVLVSKPLGEPAVKSASSTIGLAAMLLKLGMLSTWNTPPMILLCTLEVGV